RERDEDGDGALHPDTGGSDRAAPLERAAGRRHPRQGLARNEDGTDQRSPRTRRVPSFRVALMLYLLFYPFSDRIPILNVLRYPSFRILAAGLVSLGVGLLLGPSYIEAMREKQYGVSAVREDTP